MNTPDVNDSPNAPATSAPRTGSAATPVKEWHVAAAKAWIQDSTASYPPVRKMDQYQRELAREVLAQIIAIHEPPNDEPKNGGQ